MELPERVHLLFPSRSSRCDIFETDLFSFLRIHGRHGEGGATRRARVKHDKSGRKRDKDEEEGRGNEKGNSSHVARLSKYIGKV
jgi:hypothetical protein